MAAVLWANVSRTEGDYRVDTSSSALSAYKQAYKVDPAITPDKSSTGAKA